MLIMYIDVQLSTFQPFYFNTANYVMVQRQEAYGVYTDIHSDK